MNITYKTKQQQQLNKIIGMKQLGQSYNDLNQSINTKGNTTLSKDQSSLKHEVCDLSSNSLNLGRSLNSKFERSQNNNTPLEEKQYFQNGDNILKELKNFQSSEGRKSSTGNENQSFKSLERKHSK